MANKARRHLHLRGRKYWFKRDIPQTVRSHFGGKSAYLVNLETGDIRAAIERRDELERETDLIFKNAREGRPTAAARDTIKDLAEIWATQLAESRRDPVAWSEGVSILEGESETGEPSFDAYSLLDDTADKIESVHGEKARTRFMDIAHGHVDIDHHLDAYLTEARLAPKTSDERRNLVRRFAEWAKGESLTLSKINRAVAGRYFASIIAPMHPSTAKKHSGSVKLYWDYLIMRGHAHGKNPWEGQTMPNRGRRVERGGEAAERPFTEAEIKALLYSPFPDGIKVQFKEQLQDAMRISALSGMRLAEVITLWVEECEIGSDGKGWFDIRQGKTSAAARKVPIHPDLLSIVRRRKANKEPTEWLFHELSKERDAGDIFSKRFAAYRKKLKIEDVRIGKRRSLVNFHSFRRWFVTQAEQAGQQESIISEVVGHEEGRKSITLKVYSGGPSDEQKRICVEAVALPNSSLLSDNCR